jgi:hypothetical protein
MNLNELSKPALAAAMKGGTSGWGRMGSSTDNVRYAQLLPKVSRRLCSCGCEQRNTHAGMANGVSLTSGCQLSIQRWIKTGSK